MTFKKRKLIVMVAFDLFQVWPRNPLKRGFLLVRGGEVGVSTYTPTFIMEVVVHVMVIVTYLQLTPRTRGISSESSTSGKYDE